MVAQINFFKISLYLGDAFFFIEGMQVTPHSWSFYIVYNA